MGPTLIIVLVLSIGIVVGFGAVRIGRPSWLSQVDALRFAEQIEL
jgi:hypothetical protein